MRLVESSKLLDLEFFQNVQGEQKVGLKKQIAKLFGCHRPS